MKRLLLFLLFTTAPLLGQSKVETISISTDFTVGTWCPASQFNAIYVNVQGSGNQFVCTPASPTANYGSWTKLGGSSGAANVTWTLTPTDVIGVTEACAHWSIPYTSIQASATTQDITLFTLPAGYQMESHVRESTSFTGPTGLTAASVSIGMTALAATEYMLPFPLFQTANTLRYTSGMYSAQYAAHAVYLEFKNTTAVSPINFGNGTATNFTAGREEVHVCVQQLP
jgi:hypothetical protein